MNSHNTNQFDPQPIVTNLKEQLVKMSYSKTTIDRLDSVWQNFLKYTASHNVPEFTLQVIDEFIGFRYGYLMGDKDRAHNVRRAMNMLWDFAQYGHVFKHSSLTLHVFDVGYRDSIEGFLSSLKCSGYSDGSLKTFRSRMYQFQEFLLNCGIPSVNEITQECLQEYIQSLERGSVKTTMRKLRLLKQWLSYCYEHKYLDVPLSPVIPKIREVRVTSLPTVFTGEEVNALLEAVDRANPLGRRDYAILTMAATLGLRISDIIGLTFDEIDWTKKTLSIIQQKTGKLVELPLPENVGWAIIDYLRSGRPQSSCNHVFIKHCAPYDALSYSMAKTFQKYMRRAGIQRPAGKPIGMHTLRHSLASAMLEKEIPLPIITGTLGHRNPHTTETYLRIAISQLRKCALEVID